MLVQCPHCGKSVVVNGLGRKAFNMPVTKVCDALLLQGNVREAAKSLGCSCAFIYKILKTKGLTPSEVLNGLATKDNSLLHKGAVNG